MSPEMAGSETLAATARSCRRRLLKMHFERRIGHIGGNLSALDALLALHHRVMESPDRFVLSKGHAAGALYITLWSLGLLSDAQLETFHGDGTLLAGHPVPNWSRSIPVATGSLGHGFPMAVGMALSRQLSATPGHIYCLTSDGEWQEGSMWEALIFLAHRRLKNITVLVDMNGLQGYGSTQDVASMRQLDARISGFGLPLIQVDGHDHQAIAEAVSANPGAVVLLRTTKGKGVSFMEDRMEWHYLPLNKDQFEQALRELDDEVAPADEPELQSRSGLT